MVRCTLPYGVFARALACAVLLERGHAAAGYECALAVILNAYSAAYARVAVLLPEAQQAQQV